MYAKCGASASYAAVDSHIGPHIEHDSTEQIDQTVTYRSKGLMMDIELTFIWTKGGGG